MQNKNSKTHSQGITLIEAMIFTVLLSFLIMGFIRYASAIYDENMRLINDINNKNNPNVL